MPNNRKKTTTKTTAESQTIREDEIRRRAYQLYEERGRQNGFDLDDWLRAESEITSKAAKAVSA